MMMWRKLTLNQNRLTEKKTFRSFTASQKSINETQLTLSETRSSIFESPLIDIWDYSAFRTFVSQLSGTKTRLSIARTLLLITETQDLSTGTYLAVVCWHSWRVFWDTVREMLNKEERQGMNSHCPPVRRRRTSRASRRKWLRLATWRCRRASSSPPPTTTLTTTTLPSMGRTSNWSPGTRARPGSTRMPRRW